MQSFKLASLFVLLIWAGSFIHGFATSSIARRGVQVFLCGYSWVQLAQSISPKSTVMELSANSTVSVDDILLYGMHAPCPESAGFRGKIVYFNGEPYSSPMVPNAYYLGPSIESSVRQFQLYLVSVASLQIAGSFDAFKTRPLGTGRHFLIHISSRCIRHRQVAFDAFSNVSKVAAAGECHGEWTQNYEQITGPGLWFEAHKLYRDYKFGLVMENTDRPGYVSEKILTAFLGGTVPIYYGTQEVLKIFNPRAFVYMNASVEEAIIQVKYLLQNRSAYEVMRREPILAPGAYETYFSFSGALSERLRSFLDIAVYK